jgi:hypothetical protein
MHADWHTRRRDGVTLVEVVLETGTRRRVRVANACDGPVLPPREAGVPAEGWDEEGFAGVVEGTRPLGYATPAPPADPPVRVTWGDPVAEAPSFDGHPAVPAMEATAAGVVRALGETGPPRDAVPDPEIAPDEGGGATAAADAGPAAAGVDRARADGGDVADGAGAPGAADAGGADPGDAPAATFEAVRGRIERGEALATAETLPEVTDAVAAVGGLEDVRALEAELARDAERLRETEELARALRERVEALDIPVERLERLA